MAHHLDYRYCTADYRPRLRHRLRRALVTLLVRLRLRKPLPQAERWPEGDPRRLLMDLRQRGEQVHYDRRYGARLREQNLSRMAPPFTCAPQAPMTLPAINWWRVNTGLALCAGLLILGAKIFAHAVFK